jgi:uncharacterized DUF497 family protein
MPKKIDVELTGYRFEWDEIKNRSNIRKHGFDFADAEEMFRNNLLARPDTRQDYGERRWIGIGAIRGSSRRCGLCRTWLTDHSDHLSEKGVAS